VQKILAGRELLAKRELNQSNYHFFSLFQQLKCRSYLFVEGKTYNILQSGEFLPVRWMDWQWFDDLFTYKDI